MFEFIIVSCNLFIHSTFIEASVPGIVLRHEDTKMLKIFKDKEFTYRRKHDINKSVIIEHGMC